MGGFEFFMCQSFAKNLGLYGERIGCVHIVCSTAEQAKCVGSQMKLVIRPMYSSPPKHGALLVVKVLGNPERLAKWKVELKAIHICIVRLHRDHRFRFSSGVP